MNSKFIYGILCYIMLLLLTSCVYKQDENHNTIINNKALQSNPNTELKTQSSVETKSEDSKEQTSFDANPTNDSHIFTVSFRDKINADIHEFEFDLLAHEDSDIYRTQKITIKDSKTNAVLQVIDSLDVWSPDKNTLGFIIEDINFDGFKDIRIVLHGGAPDNPYECWLWDDHLRQFIYNQELSFIANLEVDAENQTLVSYTRSDAIKHTGKFYKYVDGKLTLVKQIAMGETVESEDGYFDITYELIRGEWKETSKVPTSLRG